jgi:predicted MFS family arabinose efflux permease
MNSHRRTARAPNVSYESDFGRSVTFLEEYLTGNPAKIEGNTMNNHHPSLARTERFSLLIVATLAWLSFASLPYEVASLSSRFGVNEAIAGWIASAELLALAIAAVVAGRSIEFRDKRLLSVTAVAIAIAGSLLSTFAENSTTATVSRLIVGAGLGVLTATTNALPAMYKGPEKTYAQMLLTMSFMFSALMYCVPSAISEFGPRGFDFVELLLLVFVGLFSFGVPRAKLKRPVISSVSSSPKVMMPAGVMQVLVSIFAMFASQAVCWTFAEAAAQVLHLTEAEVTTAFTALALAQIPAALAATWLGTRLGYRLPIVIGLILLIAISFGMYVVPTRLLFLASTITLSAALTFTLPYVQALLAELDDTGRSAAIGGAILNLGAAAGPALGALFFSLGGLRYIGFSSAVLLVIALGLALSGVHLFQKTRTVSIA